MKPEPFGGKNAAAEEDREVYSSWFVKGKDYHNARYHAETIVIASKQALTT
ncbi:hypothetical protein MA16_Dca014583 [Dendrobium catenatum]|uniref:Uncharacterized protein n=1 Tax=Dendrobium catenatum TaxID=906689 RepID=A0A2I0XJT0_9ASPA|nr:hypothetical protein MA16_Dca014583 [Dendrobium catenatum]